MTATMTKPTTPTRQNHAMPPVYPIHEGSRLPEGSDDPIRLAELREMGTAQALLEHLARTGTGRERLDAIAELLRQSPDMTPKQIFEWGRDVRQMHLRNERGTLQKIGVFAYGDSFTLVDPQAPVSSREEELRATLEIERKAARDKDLENSLLQRRLNDALQKLARYESEGDTPSPPPKQRKPVKVVPAVTDAE